MKETLQQVALRRARDYAGGVSYLSHKLSISAHDLDAMLCGNERIPMWVFLRAIDFLNEAESRDTPPPGFPEDWRDPIDPRQ